MLRNRHALEVRLLEGTASGRACLGKLLVDYFYTRFSHAHQQTTLLERHEPALRTMQTATEQCMGALDGKRSALQAATAKVARLCEQLSAPPADVAIPRTLLPTFTPLLGGGGADAADGDAAAAQVAPEAGAPGAPGKDGCKEVGKEGVLFVQQGLLRQWRRCWCVISGGTLQVYKLGKAVSVGAARGGREASDGLLDTAATQDLGSHGPLRELGREIASFGVLEAGGKPGEVGGGLLSRQQLVVEVPLTLCNVKPVRTASRFYLELRSPTTRSTCRRSR